MTTAGSLLLLALLAGASVGAPGRELDADGTWRTFRIDAPGRTAAFLFEVVAGCRYRVVAEGRTLSRVLVEVGPGEATRWRADSGLDAPPDGGEEAAAPAAGSDRPRARLTFDAEIDGVYEVRVKGFSVLTGRGRVKLETLGPGDRPTDAHRRHLVPGETLARVGSLWVDETNRWRLDVAAGKRYEVHSRPGTSGPLVLRVVAAKDGTVLAEASPTGERPWPTVAFAAPEAAGGDSPPLLVLEVQAVDGAGGTYGVRLDEAGRKEPDEDAAAGAPEPAVVRGTLDAPPLAFRANPGDLAVLYLPRAPAYDPHALVVLRGGDWHVTQGDPISTLGRRASMRTPESAALVWFQPHRSGTYRFLERRLEGARLRVYGAEAVRGAPLLLGTGLDPTVSARGEGGWKAIGLGVCMPGWDYLYVAVGRRPAPVSMRVRTVGDERLAFRPSRGLALARVAGLGPSLRFRVREPTVVRLELEGKGWEGYALLRRASN